MLSRVVRWLLDCAHERKRREFWARGRNENNSFSSVASGHHDAAREGAQGVSKPLSRRRWTPFMAARIFSARTRPGGLAKLRFARSMNSRRILFRLQK